MPRASESSHLNPNSPRFYGFEGLGFKGLGFNCLRLRVWGSGLRVQDLGFRV